MPATDATVTFVLPRSHVDMLDRLAKQKLTSRSAVLRQILEATRLHQDAERARMDAAS